MVISTHPVEATTMQNGLRLVARPVPSAHSVALSVHVRSGACHEQSAADSGLAHFLEHVCYKGSVRRPSERAMALEMDDLGGFFNATTADEYTTFDCVVADSDAVQALDLLLDAVSAPLIRDADIEHERAIIRDEIDAAADSPELIAHDALSEMLWPRHPLGRPMGGTRESVDALPAERVRDYHRAQYSPDACVVVAAGAIRPEHLERAAEAAVQSWALGKPARLVPVTNPVSEQRVAIRRRDYDQATISMGLRTIGERDPDQYALTLFGSILGGGSSSRFYGRLRTELGLCYDAGAVADLLGDHGMLHLFATTDSAQAVRVVQEMGTQLARLCEDDTPAELARAQRRFHVMTQIDRDAWGVEAAWFGRRDLLGLPPVSSSEAQDCIEAVTINDLRRVAAGIRDGDALRVAAVVPPSTDAGALHAAVAGLRA